MFRCEGNYNRKKSSTPLSPKSVLYTQNVVGRRLSHRVPPSVVTPKVRGAPQEPIYVDEPKEGKERTRDGRTEGLRERGQVHRSPRSREERSGKGGLETRPVTSRRTTKDDGSVVARLEGGVGLGIGGWWTRK